MAATKKTEQLLEIKPVKMQTVPLRIVGDSPLIVHAWDAKNKREILEKDMNITKTKNKDPKNPIEEFAASMYWLNPMPDEITEESIGIALQSARFGFPLTGIKQAGISAAYRMGWVKDKMSLRGAFYIEPDAEFYYGGDLVASFDNKKIIIKPNAVLKYQLVEIHSDAPVMREDMVRIGMGTSDVRYRGEYNNWHIDFRLKFNTNGKFTLEQIINIINAGGAVCGIGEWRPERDGQYGMYHVEANA